MNPDKINAADHEFVRKLHRLRSKLGVRQREHESSTPGSVFNYFIAVFLTLSLFAGWGYAVIYKKKRAAATHTRQQGASADLAAIHQAEQMTHPTGQSADDEERPFVSDPPAHAGAAAQEMARSAQTPIGTEEEAASLDEKAVGYAPPPGNDQQGEDTVDARLVSAVVCDGVEGRQHSGEKALFYSGSDSRAYVWMEVRSDKQPFVINHIYYHNGQKYCDVQLDIKYSRMRTWSYVTLQETGLTGAWRVEIVCNSSVMKTVRFNVRDGNTTSGL